MSLISVTELTGRELAQAYEKETGKSISYGTLYTTMRRLEEEKWVSSREDTDADGRLKYFKLTNGGHAALRAAHGELRRLLNFGSQFA